MEGKSRLGAKKFVEQRARLFRPRSLYFAGRWLARPCPRRQNLPWIGKSVEDLRGGFHFLPLNKLFGQEGFKWPKTLFIAKNSQFVPREKQFVRSKQQLVHNVAFGFVHRLRIAPDKAETPERMRSDVLIWRRRGDSNSRAGYPTYALSRGASSPT